MTPTSFKIRRRTTIALVSASAALAMVASGCGVSGSTATGSASGVVTPTTTVNVTPESFSGTGGAQFLRSAAEATSEVKTAKVSMTMKVNGIPGADDVAITYEGAFDNETGRGSMTIDMGGLLGPLASSLGGPNSDGSTIEMVTDGDTVYLKSPLFSALGGSDKPWMKADSSQLSGDGAQVSGGLQSDPGAFVDFLKGAGGELETVGREDVRGVPTTHLRTELDLAKMSSDLPEAERQKLDDQLSGLGAAGATLNAIPAEAWVDDNGYVRRFRLDMSDMVASGTSSSMGMTMEIEMYDFNEPVEVQIPDPSEVGEMSAGLLGGN